MGAVIYIAARIVGQDKPTPTEWFVPGQVLTEGVPYVTDSILTH